MPDLPMTDLGKTQLNAILSALDGQPRNPNTKDAALRRIGAHAERCGLGLDDLLAAAGGLLDGRMSAEEFRTSLQDDAAEAAGRVATVEDEGDGIETTCAAPLATGAAPEPSAEQPAKVRKHRDGTKEAVLIDMLRRPEGATIAQIMAATGWLGHTVRGAFAGALKKKRGLIVTSEKPDGAERVYRLTD